MKECRIGLIGHDFMGRVHSHAYATVPKYFDLPARPVLQAVCGRSASVAPFAQRWGWQSYTHDYRELVARDDIDAVDISTPNHVHAEMAIAAAENGKAVLCEKPLAMNATEGAEIVDAVAKNGVISMVAFNYRRCPAVALMRSLIEKGAIGRVYHVRAQYLQDWIMDPRFPRVWRLEKALAGSGVHGDLNAHIIDMARYLAGEITAVVGMTETFITERPLEDVADQTQDGCAMAPVDVDDACAFLARFDNGAMGTFEATRFGGGHKNGLQFEINGDKGTFRFAFEDMNVLWYYNREAADETQGFQRILVTEATHPYVGNWWPPGHIIGYEHTFVHLVADFIRAVAEKTPLMPDVADALKTQKVLDAVLTSAHERAWVSIT